MPHEMHHKPYLRLLAMVVLPANGDQDEPGLPRALV
jgi:hypothetical protein